MNCTFSSRKRILEQFKRALTFQIYIQGWCQENNSWRICELKHYSDTYFKFDSIFKFEVNTSNGQHSKAGKKKLHTFSKKASLQKHFQNLTDTISGVLLEITLSIALAGSIFYGSWASTLDFFYEGIESLEMTSSKHWQLLELCGEDDHVPELEIESMEAAIECRKTSMNVRLIWQLGAHGSISSLTVTTIAFKKDRWQHSWMKFKIIIIIFFL